MVVKSSQVEGSGSTNQRAGRAAHCSVTLVPRRDVQLRNVPALPALALSLPATSIERARDARPEQTEENTPTGPLGSHPRLTYRVPIALAGFCARSCGSDTQPCSLLCVVCGALGASSFPAAAALGCIPLEPDSSRTHMARALRLVPPLAPTAMPSAAHTPLARISDETDDSVSFTRRSLASLTKLTTQFRPNAARSRL